MELRHPAPGEQQRVHATVQAIVDETYAFIWPSGAPPITHTDWTKGWIAEIEGKAAGIVLTDADWLEDLWIVHGFRGRGIGARLLSFAEAEIAARGLGLARLRVVEGNDRALAFYQRHGWIIENRATHARLPIVMIGLGKRLR